MNTNSMTSRVMNAFFRTALGTAMAAAVVSAAGAVLFVPTLAAVALFS